MASCTNTGRAEPHSEPSAVPLHGLPALAGRHAGTLPPTFAAPLHGLLHSRGGMQTVQSHTLSLLLSRSTTSSGQPLRQLRLVPVVRPSRQQPVGSQRSSPPVCNHEPSGGMELVRNRTVFIILFNSCNVIRTKCCRN